MSALPLPNARIQIIDADGAPLVGGQVFTYIPGTDTPKSTWQDRNQTILNNNPIPLDDLGSAAVFGDGAYRQVVYDSVGNLLWDGITENGLSGFADINLSNVNHSVFYGPGEYDFSTNTDLSAVPISMLNGAMFNVSAGTLILPQAFEAPATKVFNVTGSGAVVFRQAPYTGVLPQWWGAQSILRGLGAQNVVQQDINATSLEAAFAAIPQGSVVLPTGDMYFRRTVRGARADQQGLVGAGDNASRLFWTVPGVAKLVHGSGLPGTFINENFFIGYSTYRTVAPICNSAVIGSAGFCTTATIGTTTTTPPSFAQIQNYAVGEVFYGMATPEVRNTRHADDFIGYYWSYTTNTRGSDAFAVRTIPLVLAGDMFYGHYLDGRGTPIAGTSMNGSWFLNHALSAATGFTGTSYGFVNDGRTSTVAANGDIRDWLPTNLEVAGVSVGVMIVSSGTFDTDVHLKSIVLDNCTSIGVFVHGLGVEGVVLAPDAHINGGLGASQLAFINSCDGKVEIIGDWDGGAGWATVVGAYLHNSNKARVGGRFINCQYSVIGDGTSSACTVTASDHGNVAGHNGVYRVWLQASCTLWDIELQVGSGTATNIIKMDGGTSNNTYRNPKNIGTYVAPTAIAGSGNTAFG